MAAEEKWYFTKEQLANTPSRKCGYDVDKELSYRQQAANFIQDMGQRLLVTQLCINTAIVYMHRFYVFHSFTHFHRNSMASASLFLAAKVEEQPRKLEHVIKVAHMCLHRDQQPLDTKSEQYLEQATDLVFNENVLLQTLGFDVAIDHPHTHVVRCCHLVRASKDLAQTSYFMASNSLHLTTMCLQYKPTVVACFCIHLACKWSNWEIPQSKEGKDWFWYVDKTVSLDQLEQLTAEFLVIFDKCPTKLKHKIKSISASQNTVVPQALCGSPFDMEPRKIRPPDGSQEGPSFRPHHPLAESKPSPVVTPEDPFKKSVVAPPAQPRNYREYCEKKERTERERVEREKLAAAQPVATRDEHHHTRHHGQPHPPNVPVVHSGKPGFVPPPQHQLKPGARDGQRSGSSGSGVNAAREAARREQALVRHAARNRSEQTIRSDSMFAPPVRHDMVPEVGTVDPAAVINHISGASASGVNSSRKDTPSSSDWSIDGDVHVTPSEKFRDKDVRSLGDARHSQPDPSKRSGPNSDASRHSKASSDSRVNASVVLSSDLTRVGTKDASRGEGAKVSTADVDLHQKHQFNHVRSHGKRSGYAPDHLPDVPDTAKSARSSSGTTTPSSVKSSKHAEHRPDPLGTPVSNTKKEEDVTSNGKPPSRTLPLIISHHHKLPKDKSPSVQQQTRPKSPPSTPQSAPLRPRSPPSASLKVGPPPLYFAPGQPKIETRNGTVPEEKHHLHPSEPASITPKSEPVASPPPTPTLTPKSQKPTPDKSGPTLREPSHRSSKSRQRTPPAAKKPLLQEVSSPVSPTGGLVSPFGSPPPPTPTTPGKGVLPPGTPSSNRRNRTSSSSSEPELVPVVKKLDEIAGYENIIRDSKMGIKLPGRVPDIIQPIRDRRKEELGMGGQTARSGAPGPPTSVAKELKPPELIRPFAGAGTQPGAELGAVAFPSPGVGALKVEPDTANGYGAQIVEQVVEPALSMNVSDVVSVVDPAQAVEKTLTMSVPSGATPLSNVVVENVTPSKKSLEHHHKSEKKKKKEKHRHKEHKERKEHREGGKHRHKNKEKDRERHNVEVTGVALPPCGAAPIKITIPKDKLTTVPLPSNSDASTGPSHHNTSAVPGAGIKIKIQKDRLLPTEPSVASPPPPPVTGIKIKISKESGYSSTTSVPSSGKESSRKRDRSSPRADSASGQPPAKAARTAESSSRRSTSGYSKQNGIESSSSRSRGQHHSGHKVRYVPRVPPPHMGYGYPPYYHQPPQQMYPFMYPPPTHDSMYPPPLMHEPMYQQQMMPSHESMYGYFSTPPPPPSMPQHSYVMYHQPPPVIQPPLPEGPPPLPEGPPPNPPPPPPPPE